MEIAFTSAIVSVLAIVAVLPLGWWLGTLVRQLRVWLGHWHWRRQSVVYAEYTAPDNLRPAEVAYLYDRVFGQDELLATLFDLEKQKRLALKPKKGRRLDFDLLIIGDPMADDLLPFEQEVMLTIKGFGQRASWSTLKTNTAIWDSSIEQSLQIGLSQKGYLAVVDHWSSVIKFWLIGAVIAGLTVVLPMVWQQVYGPKEVITNSVQANFASLDQFLAIVGLVLLWLLVSITYGLAVYYGLSTYRRAMDMEQATDRLRQLWPHLVGFREYLRVVEQDRIKFDNKELRLDARANALPYAVALKLSTRWQDRFR